MTQVFAHRGFSGYYPENTIIAFKKAIEAGVHGIELDVQVSKDGELVIIHDETLKRTTSGTGYVKDYTLEELKRLDASTKMYKRIKKEQETSVEAIGNGKSLESLDNIKTEISANTEDILETLISQIQRIPTLREYFELVKDTSIITNIELKTGIFEYPGIEKMVIDLVDEYQLSNQVWYSSFNHYTLLRCQELRPNATYGFLIDGWFIGMGRYTKQHGGTSVNARYPYFTKDMVGELQAHGITSQAWTPNSLESIKWLVDNGVDVLITNYPDRAFHVIEPKMRNEDTIKLKEK